MREGIYQENEAYGIQRIIKKRSEGRKKKERITSHYRNHNRHFDVTVICPKICIQIAEKIEFKCSFWQLMQCFVFETSHSKYIKRHKRPQWHTPMIPDFSLWHKFKDSIVCVLICHHKTKRKKRTKAQNQSTLLPVKMSFNLSSSLVNTFNIQCSMHTSCYSQMKKPG